MVSITFFRCSATLNGTHLLDQVDSEDEDQRTNDTDGQQAYDAGTSDEDAKAGGGEEETRDASRSADLVEEDLYESISDQQTCT